MEWTKTRKTESGYDFDYFYTKTNEDETKEKLRFVIYPDTEKGKVHVYYNKIRKIKDQPSGLREGEEAWVNVAGSSGWVWKNEVEEMYGVKLPQSRLDKIVKIVKDIFNDTRNKRDIH